MGLDQDELENLRTGRILSYDMEIIRKSGRWAAACSKADKYSKSPGPCALAGSTPASGTSIQEQERAYESIKDR